MSELERPPEDTLRDRAITVLKKRRDFHAHLLVYVLFNAGLVVVWATATPTAFFWPIFPLAFWGIGVVMNAWDVYVSGDFSEDRIQRRCTGCRAGTDRVGARRNLISVAPPDRPGR